MKHKFTFLMAALMLLSFLVQPLGTMGQTKDEVVTYTLNGTITGGSSGYAEESTITQSDITWKVMGNTTMNPWRIGGKNITEIDRPVYSTMTISDNITKIVVTHGTASNITVNSMTLIVSANADFSSPTSTITGDFAASSTTTFERPVGADWTNKYYKIVYNVSVSGNTNRFVQFISAEFYKENGGSGSQTVATPTFSPAAGTYYEAQNVTLNCATDGATIYYTTDGNDPEPAPAGYTGTVYSSPISVSTTTTIKAIATKDNMSASAIATAVYTIQQLPTITSIDSLWTFATSVGSTQPNQVNANVTFNNWYVTGIRNNQVCVSDGQYGFVIFQSGHGFTAGDKLSGTVACKVLLYQNHYAEITGVKATDLTVTPNQEIPVLQTTIGALETRNYGTAIDLGTLVYDGTTFNDVTGAPITPYNNFNLDPNPISSLEANKEYHVKGVSIIYWTSAGQTQQIAPRDANDFELIDNPTFYAINIDPNIANGTVTADTLWATEGTPVVLTVIPDDNYQLETLTYSYTGTAPIDISDSHQFTMPACDVDVTATFSPIQMETVATPTFDPAEGTYTSAQTVAILCETQGATIYYTLDGNDPITPTGIIGTEFTEAITISETTTVKAIAVRDGMNSSEIATATYTIETGPSVISIAEARSMSNNEYAMVQGIVTFIDGRNVYIQDESAGIDLYLDDNTVPSTLALGDMVQAYGKKTVYKGLVELQNINGGNAEQFSILSTGNTLPLEEASIALINDDAAGANFMQSTRVQIVGAVIGTINNNNNTPIEQNGSSINIYKMPVVDGLLEGDSVTVTCIIGCFNNVQLRVANAADVVFTHPQTGTVANPTFSPAAGTYTSAQTVTIACATDGATIYYTTDGTDPITPTGITGTQYTQPFTISETTTVKAVATKEGMDGSEIVSAEYIIQAPTPSDPTDYTLITDASALVAGCKYIVVGIKSESYKALGKQASNNRVAVDVTPENNVISITPATTNEDGVFELTLGQDSVGYWTLYDAVNQGYLYAASSTSNHLKTQVTNDANGQWTIEIASDGVATIKAQGTNTRNWMRLNNNGTPFSCYGSGQLDVYLYKAGDVPTPTLYAVNIDPNITNGTVTANPTQAAEGATVTLTVTPDNNYELATLTYSYTGSTPIDIKETKQFVMPACDVNVTATFTEVLIPTVATPTFTPAAGTYYEVQSVTIACATEGATIYYTTDGSSPISATGPAGTAYTGDIAINETTTIKAVAVKDGMNSSEIATATYNIVLPITIAEAKAIENNNYALVQGVVTFIDGRNVYIQDTTAGIDLYLNSNTVPTTLAIGDVVRAYGKKTVFNGLIELTSINGGNADQFSILANGNELPVAVKTIAEILADYNTGANMLQSTRVQIVDAVIGEINTSNNTPITQDENTLNIYKMPVVEGLLEGDFVTVIGIVGCYNNPQLRVANANDVEFTHPAYPMLTANPNALSGFTYAEGEGPSTIKTFVLTGSNLTSTAYVYPSENFQISTFGGDNFVPEYRISVNTATGNFSYNIYVRMKEDLAIGTYNESLTLCSADTDTAYMAVSGTVTAQAQSSEYTRIFELSQLENGSKVIFAARFDDNTGDYYAMTAQASGKPTGVLFSSVIGTNSETLPSTIADEESTYYWTVATDGTNYTFTNANGDVLGYTSSTNFATGGDNTAWAITYQTSEASAMVPEYSGFVVNNVNNNVRAIALNSNHNFGPYHTQNMASENYNFFLDLFATTGGGGTMTCATPTFTPAPGTYYEAQTVTISCTTADASIYYTLDGTEPNYSTTPIVGTLYEGPITISETTTIKAIAVKEGYEDSGVATAEYSIIVGAATIFNQDWEGDMNGWTFVNVEGNKPWSVAVHNNNHYAYANGYNDDTDNEQWCISPAFNLDNYSDVTLTFMNAKNYTGPDMQVFFSNDYDGEDPTNASWTELTYTMSTGSYAWTESGAIQLIGFAGDNCYIGFRYTSTLDDGAAAWEVDDILLVGFTSAPTLTTTATSLSGFSYFEGNGPSTEQSFTISGMNLTEDILVTLDGEDFEMSTESGEDFDPMSEIEIEVTAGTAEQVIYVRMAEGLAIGDYTDVITVESELDDITVTLSGTVNEQPQGGDWNRILSLSDLNNGDMVILASRYDATIGNGYYAMPAVVSGKPDGVLFTSVNENGTETLPAEISAEAETYYWNVILNDNIIQLINVSGDTIGYNSSTNFSGNVNTEWNIAYETSDEGAMIPNYSGFVITNATTTNRGFAKNASNKFGAYSTSNIGNADYNFYLDIFVQGGTSTPTVAAPVFSVASGTYYEEFEVEITCATDGATIYYTTDGTEPTAESEVYEEPILVDQDMTIKAIAMMEGYENSTVTTVSYTIITDVQVIFSQDWEGEMNGWTFVTVEGNKPWNINTYAGNKFANANGYNDDSDNEQWCISPAFDLDQYNRDVEVTLTFMNATKFNGPALELYFSNDYDGEDPTAATWIPLDYIQSEGNYEWVESGPVTMNGFSGENCYIGFRYISTLDEGAASWEIDDIVLTAKVVTTIDETLSWNVNVWNRDHEILIENEGSDMHMVVYNILGQPVLNANVHSGSNTIYHNLNFGMYIVTLQNNEGRMSTKIVVK